MISAKEAQQYINDSLIELRSKEVPLDHSIGSVLDAEIVADRDFPPFDRVMMDGIAIQWQSYESGCRHFTVQAIHPAGSPPPELKESKNCFEVMTGAVLPKGCDTVIRYEDVEFIGVGDDKEARIGDGAVSMGSHVHLKGTDRKMGSKLIREPKVVGPAEVGVLATVGASRVRIKEWPEIAIVSSGDELVDVDKIPKQHQIRQSNGHAIAASLKSIGVQAKRYHVSDEQEKVVSEIAKLMEHHKVIVLSGGVSKGKKDYIPGALEENGIKKVFHRVAQRPGKPFWFGTSDHGHYVFAFPGNPVSTFMCYYRYFEPWLFRSAGIEKKPQSIQLADDFQFDPPLTYFLQVSVHSSQGVLLGQPVVGHGSGDLANLLEAEGFIELPSNQSSFKKGDSFNYFPYRPR